MGKPFRLLGESMQQFAIGLGPAIVMAFACVAFQLTVLRTIGFVSQVLSPPKPQGDPLAFLNDPPRHDWQTQAADLFQSTTAVSIFFFFHALVALVLTAWLLRKHAAFDGRQVLRRALRGAAMLTGAAALVSAAASLLGDVFPTTLALLAFWFACTALLLPARLMGHAPPPGLLKSTLTAAIALVPWLLVSELAGARLRNCRECGGLFEGGIVFYPLLGAYLLGLTVSSAAVSAAACMLDDPGPAPAHAP
ncbi:MAG TPA: hypothetical protein VGF28_14395 [Thermoanaerobaculia bacterium]|jgi:hypothetical protein